MDSELTAQAAVPAQKTSELPPGFHEMVGDLKSIVRGAHVRAQLKVNTEMADVLGDRADDPDAAERGEVGNEGHREDRG